LTAEIGVRGDCGRFRVAKAVPQEDLIFLEASIGEGEPLFMVSTGNLGEAPLEPIFAIGYPRVHLREVWHKSRPDFFFEVRKRISRGLFIKKSQRQSLNGVKISDSILHNVDILPGSSGGALVDRAGRLVGINTGIVDYPFWGRRRDLQKVVSLIRAKDPGLAAELDRDVQRAFSRALTRAKHRDFLKAFGKKIGRVSPRDFARIVEVVSLLESLETSIKLHEYRALTPDDQGRFPESLSRYNFSVSSKVILREVPEGWREHLPVKQ
jgi:hypothetical protein